MRSGKSGSGMAAKEAKPGCCAGLKHFIGDDGILQQHIKLFGVLQVLLGIVQVTGGIALAVTVPYSPAVTTGTPWWSGVMSIISGVFAVHCAESPTEDFKTTTLVINALHATTIMIAIFMYSLSTSLNLMLVFDFLPIIPMTLTCVLIGFSLWNLFATIPVCLVYYQHHPRVRRRQNHSRPLSE